MRDESWTIPDHDNEDWPLLLRDLEAAQATPFAQQSRELMKPHHAGFSFQEAMWLALDGGTWPLARFLRDRRGRNLLSDREWKHVAVYIDSLWRMPNRRPGRPRGGFFSSQRTDAEWCAAEMVASRKQAWRAAHHRKRVPKKEIDAMIEAAIDKIAAERNVPKRKILVDNIRNILKSGRVSTQ